MRTALLFCLAAFLCAAETITLRADSYAPFNGDPKSDKPGYLIEIAKEVFGKRGAVVDYQLMPWSRSLEQMKAGHIDGAPGAEVSQISEFSYPAVAQGYWRPVFATPAASRWAYTGLDSLATLSIGVVQDYDYGKDPKGNSYNQWFEKNPKNMQVLKGDKPIDLAMGMLAKGRLDLFFEDWGVILAACASAKVDPAMIRNAGSAGPGYEVFIAFSPNERGKALAKELAEGTSALRASGRLKEILARYGVSDWK